MKHSLKLMKNICSLGLQGREEGGSRGMERGIEEQKEVICHASTPCKSDVHI